MVAWAAKLCDLFNAQDVTEQDNLHVIPARLNIKHNS